MKAFWEFGQIKVKWRKFIIETVGKLTGIKVKEKETQTIHFYSLLGMLFLITLMIYLSGGISPITHLLYLPIILSSFILSYKKAAFIAFLSGLLIGPYMPADVANHIMQSQESWILRLIMFLIISFFLSNISYYIRTKNDMDRDKMFTDEFSGYPNISSLKNKMKVSMKENREQEISMALIQFSNLDSIYRLTNYEKGKELLTYLIENLTEYFPEFSLYGVASDKVLLYVENKNVEYAYTKVKEYIVNQNKPMMIHDIPFIVNYKASVIGGKTTDFIDDLLIKLNKTLEIIYHSQSNIMKYNHQISESMDNYYITLVDICNAVNQEEFYLVYQPKTDPITGIMDGVEVLLRWGNTKYEKTPISKIVQITEDMGLINYLSSWIIEKVALQQQIWAKQGIHIKTAINLSASDINNPNIVKHIKKCIDHYKIDPKYLEFELTERCILKNEEEVFQVLKEFQEMGISISLDDYGTGHNSLNYLLEDKFIFDYIKIDKVFIDEINKFSMEALIKGIITAGHGLKSRIIAEGVEKKEQVTLLKNLGCDMIQGYYYSKPLPVEQIEAYYLQQRA